MIRNTWVDAQVELLIRGSELCLGRARQIRQSLNASQGGSNWENRNLLGCLSKSTADLAQLLCDLRNSLYWIAPFGDKDDNGAGESEVKENEEVTTNSADNGAPV